VALTIFAVGLLGIAGVQISSLNFNADSNTRSVATAIAQGELEEILAMDQADSTFASTNLGMVRDLDPNSAATTLAVPGGGSYNATWDVETNTPISSIARITVRVNAPDGRAVALTGYKRFI
jgi:type IV pilus assembly protein PilV